MDRNNEPFNESINDQMNKSIKILIIENNKNDLEIYTEFLTKLVDIQFVIYKASNGMDGVRLVNENKLDCILIDYQLPDINGIEFLNHLKENHRRVATIMIIEKGDETLALEAIKAGAQDYLVKDEISEMNLAFTIESAIDRVSLYKAIEKAHREKNNLVKELELANEYLHDFSTTVAHDLKNPINAIHSFLKLMKSDQKMEFSRDELVDKCLDSTDRMRSLIDDLLSFAKDTNESHNIEEIDLNEIIEFVSRDLEKRIKENDAIIEVEALPKILGSKTQIYQVFLNLVGNALKFIPEGRRPLVKISSQVVSRQRNGLSDKNVTEICQIKVSDNGIGMNEEDIKKIFLAFSRLHTEEEYQGTGIGLATVKKIIAYHCGSIHVESEVGKGSTFIITLPIKLSKGAQCFIRKEIRLACQDGKVVKSQIYLAPDKSFSFKVLDESDEGMRCQSIDFNEIFKGQIIELDESRRYEIRWIKNKVGNLKEFGLKLLV